MNQTTTQVGLIGWPVEHSISPAIFTAAFKARKMKWHYEAFPVEPQNLGRAINALHERGIYGFNVTVPHKQRILDFLDIIKPEARAVGAANTVSMIDNNPGHWQGTNTDVTGFSRDLNDHINIPLPGETAVILGAGGAARAAAYVLARMGYQVYVVSRHPSRGLELIRDVQAGLSATGTGDQRIESTQWRMQMRTLPWNRLNQLKIAVNLIVNCTPVGMWPDVDASPWPEDIPLPPMATIYDMVYRPTETRLMQQAQAAGLPAYNGLGMLVHQAAAAFSIWTGQNAPVDVMMDAAKRALKV